MCSKDRGDGPSVTCNPHADIDANNGEIFGHPIEYCMSNPVQGKCAVSITIIIFNLAKLAAEVFIIWSIDAKKLLLCLGDAIVSFL
jgi:hypothetical protein